MAFGDVKGTLGISATSIPANGTMTPVGSVVVSYGDLIVAAFAEVGALTIGATVTDNLGNTYTAENSGTLSSVGFRCFWAFVTNAGTLTQVQGTGTTSTDDYAAVVAVFTGPFTSSPVSLDRSPANTTDNTSPFTGSPTGVLTQTNELIVSCFGSARGYDDFSVTSPMVLAVQRKSAATEGAANSCSAAIGAWVVSATTSVTPSWTRASGTFTGCVECTMSFRKGFAPQTLTASLYSNSNRFGSARTNYVPNSTMLNAVAGSPGTMPDHWFDNPPTP